MSKLALDSFLISEETIKPSWKNWLAVVLLWIGILSHYFFSIYVNVFFYIALFLLALTTFVTYRNFQLGVRFTIGVLILGVLGLATYFPFSYHVSIGFNDYAIGIYLIPFLVGIIHVFFNRDLFAQYLSREISEEESKDAYAVAVEGFKKGFARKDILELHEITNNEILLPEARQAAEELIHELSKE